MEAQKYSFTSMNKVNRQLGMSLIEIIIVVALIAGLMAIFARSYVQTQQGVQADETKIQMGLLAQELEKFRATNYKYPESLDHLLSDPGNYKNWRGPYVEDKNLKDIWGNDLEYSREGRKYKISSAGIDGEFETDDDLFYPEEKKETEYNDE